MAKLGDLAAFINLISTHIRSDDDIRAERYAWYARRVLEGLDWETAFKTTRTNTAEKACVNCYLHPLIAYANLKSVVSEAKSPEETSQLALLFKHTNLPQVSRAIRNIGMSNKPDEAFQMILTNEGNLKIIEEKQDEFATTIMRHLDQLVKHIDLRAILEKGSSPKVIMEQINSASTQLAREKKKDPTDPMADYDLIYDVFRMINQFVAKIDRQNEQDKINPNIAYHFCMALRVIPSGLRSDRDYFMISSRICEAARLRVMDLYNNKDSRSAFYNFALDFEYGDLDLIKYEIKSVFGVDFSDLSKLSSLTLSSMFSSSSSTSISDSISSTPPTKRL